MISRALRSKFEQVAEQVFILTDELCSNPGCCAILEAVRKNPKTVECLTLRKNSLLVREGKTCNLALTKEGHSRMCRNDLSIPNDSTNLYTTAAPIPLRLLLALIFLRW